MSDGPVEWVADALRRWATLALEAGRRAPVKKRRAKG